MKKTSIRKMVVGAVIAALYTGVTYLMAFFNLAYGPVQVRLSEALTVLPIFTSAAVPGLTIGCFLANIMSFNPIDMIFGTAATLLAAALTRKFKNIKFKGIPFLSLLQPILINAIIVGVECAVILGDDGTFMAQFLLNAVFVALGQTVAVFGVGLPLYFTINKIPAVHRFFSFE